MISSTQPLASGVRDELLPVTAAVVRRTLLPSKMVTVLLETLIWIMRFEEPQLNWEV